MSRTKKSIGKGPGYDYGSARPGNAGYAQGPGTGVKKTTVRIERRVLKKKAIKEAHEEV